MRSALFWARNGITLLSLSLLSLSLLSLSLLLLPGSGCGTGHSSNTPSQTTKAATHTAHTQELPQSSALENDRDAEDGLATNSSSRFRFQDATTAWKLNVTYRNGEEAEQNAMIENLGGGVAVIDFDCDDCPDLAFTTGGRIGSDETITGQATQLWRHRGNRVDSIGLKAGLTRDNFYTHGLCVLDFDNDGFDDIFITGYGSVQLLQNMGDGRFVESSDGCLKELTGWFTSAASGDFNGDGSLDLYLCRYVDWSFKNNPFCYTPDRTKRELCSPLDFKGQDDVLLLSDGEGGWGDRSAKSGLVSGGKGLGVVACDIDDDRDTDIYVANDTTANFLYINRGDGVFEELGEIRGAAVDERALPNGSMGVLAVDINHDLQTDLWVTNFEREAFAIYRNEGEASFLHTSRRYGLGALGGNYVGFGTECQDFDLDGLDEIIVTNGHVLKYPIATPRRQNPLLLVRENDRFVKHLPNSDYFTQAHEGRGLATLDIDKDGRLDIVITHINAPATILLNQSKSDGHSLRVRLIGTSSNRNAIGARVVITTSLGRRLRSIVGGASYLSQSERTVQFGLKSNEIPLSLSIQWPYQQIQSHLPLDSVANKDELLIIEAPRL